MSTANVLCSRDTNAQIKPTPSPEKDKPKSLDYHRQVLNSRINTEPYVHAHAHEAMGTRHR